MLNAYLDPDSDQYAAACKPRVIVKRISRFFTDVYRRKTDERRRDTDRYRRERDVRIYCGEPYTDGKRIDARRDSLYEKQGRDKRLQYAALCRKALRFAVSETSLRFGAAACSVLPHSASVAGDTIPYFAFLH